MQKSEYANLWMNENKFSDKNAQFWFFCGLNIFKR